MNIILSMTTICQVYICNREDEANFPILSKNVTAVDKSKLSKPEMKKVMGLERSEISELTTVTVTVRRRQAVKK
jgi:hypothetical protein